MVLDGPPRVMHLCHAPDKDLGPASLVPLHNQILRRNVVPENPQLTLNRLVNGPSFSNTDCLTQIIQ